MRAYLHDAKRESSSLFALVTTILPEAKMSAVVLVTNPDGDCGETLRVILGIAGVQCNRFEIQTAVEVDGCNNVLKSRYDPLNSDDVLLLKGERGRGCRGLSRWRRWSSRSGGCTTLGWNLGEEVDV